MAEILPGDTECPNPLPLSCRSHLWNSQQTRGAAARW